jgi:7-carboxy-7-deazaguanine synthase
MRVAEIFESVQGETTHAGRPCSFVRLAGCDLRCRYCDTSWAWEGGEEMSVEQILLAVERLGPRFVTVTGGEPMLQEATPELCRRLLEKGFEVALETNGQARLDSLPEAVRRIVDVKTPGSGEEDRDFVNLASLRAGDEVKFVLTGEADFRFAVEVCRRFGLEGRFPILLSPVAGQLDPKDLVRWLLASGLDARLNLQLHRLVWPDETRGV